MSKVHATSVDPVGDLVDAADLLLEARSLGEFIRSMGLSSNEIHLVDDQADGFFIVMRDMLDRLQKSEELINNVLASLRDQKGGE